MEIVTQKEMKKVAAILTNHGTAAFPTDTVYGVGVQYGNIEDLNKLKELKGRDANKPIPFMVNNIEMMKTIAQVDQRTETIVSTFLPGALTLILPIKEGMDTAYTNGKKTIAIRIPDNAFILELIEVLQSPLLVSSANQSGEKEALNVKQVHQQLPGVDVIVDGICDKQQASTIVDCTKEDLVVLREGPISLKEILEAIG